MNKKICGVVGISTAALTLLSGCANIQDQIAKKVAEGVVNQATGGKVSMSDKNGNITIKDNEGNTANIGVGEQRPSSAPADMPSLPNASGFGWFGSKDGGVFTFVVPTTDYKTACNQMVTAIKAAGWSDSESGLNMEFEGSKTTMYQKPGFNMSLSCASNSDNKTTAITLSKYPADTMKGTSQSGN